jgi:FkbM family methyltransferase
MNFIVPPHHPLSNINLEFTGEHKQGDSDLIRPFLNLGRIAKLLFDKDYSLTIIDVGANVGDTAYYLRKFVDAPILCVDGCDVFFPYLLHNAKELGNIEVDKTYLDKKAGIIHAEVELYGCGWTSNLRVNPLPDNYGDLHIVDDLMTVIGRHFSFVRSKLIKLDTDGFDGSIIEGALQYLELFKPVLWWEFSIANEGDRVQGPGTNIFKMLSNTYSKALVFDNRGGFLDTVRMDNASDWETLARAYPGGTHGESYLDICAFSPEDEPIMMKFLG